MGDNRNSALEKATKALPREPSDEMVRALEAHFVKWQKIIGYTDSQTSAQCWDALQTYYLMWDAAPQPSIAGPEPELSSELSQESLGRGDAAAAAPCATCNDDPAVCATVPGLRHCEAANRS